MPRRRTTAGFGAGLVVGEVGEVEVDGSGRAEANRVEHLLHAHVVELASVRLEYEKQEDEAGPVMHVHRVNVHM